jgi:hypothetical protein
MSFAEFIDKKYGTPEEMKHVDAVQILETSYMLLDVKTVKTAERLDFLGRMIKPYFSEPELMTEELASAINLATDRVIDCMAEDIGRIHLGLAHVGQMQDDPDIYEQSLRENLCRNFTEHSGLTFSFSSFLDYADDGSAVLNTWGEHVLERLVERQILQIMELDARESKFERVYPAYSGLK